MPSDILSHRLISFRERHGLTQTDLASLLGVTPRYVSTLENGSKDIDPNSSLFRLFHAYELGQIAVRGGLNHVTHEDLQPHRVPRRADLPNVGLTAQDIISQARADLAMIEGGTQSEKRRAYHFLREVHLPMLARTLKLD